MESFLLISRRHFDNFADLALPDAIGIFGVLTYIVAYFALQIGVMRGQGILYPALNLLAASLVLYSLQTNFNLASALIQVSFISISVIGILRNWLGSYLLRLNEDEREFIASKFLYLKGHRARLLLSTGSWRKIPAGTALTSEGVVSKNVFYIARGSVNVFSGGKLLNQNGAGIFIGEISCLSASPSTATTMVSEDAYVFCICCEKLRKLVTRNADLRLIVEASFSRDTRQKVLEKNARFLTFMENRFPPTLPLLNQNRTSAMALERTFAAIGTKELSSRSDPSTTSNT